MAYSIDYINLICTDLGGTGGHAYEIDGMNEICTLIGATAGHSYNIDALNAICTALGYTAGHEYNIDALNAIYVGGAYVYEDDAWQAIQVGSKLNYNQPWVSAPITSLPEILPLIVGQEYTIYGDEIINVPIKNYLQVTYTCDLGEQVDNNFKITPTASDVGDTTLFILIKSGNITVGTYSTKLRVYEKSSAGAKKMLMVGDSVMNNGMIYYYPAIIRSILSNNTFTFLGTQGATNKHEGRSGTTWEWWATNVSSPFRKAGVIDIAAYFTDNIIDTPDYVLFQLGINDMFGNCTVTGDGLTDYELAAIIVNIKALIDAFLAYNASLKICLQLPTICENTGAGWNANYDESIYSQDNYIQAIKKYQRGLLTTFENGIYNSRVVTGYSQLFVDRNDGYPKIDNIHTNGVHPDESGQNQTAIGLASDINRMILADSLRDGNTAADYDWTKEVTVNGSNLVTGWGDASNTNSLYIEAGKYPAYESDGVRFGGTRFAKGTFTFAEPQIVIGVVKVNTWGIETVIWDGIANGSARLVMKIASPRIDIYGSSYACANSNLNIGHFAIIRMVADEANSIIKINDTAETTGDPNGADMNGIVIGANAFTGANGDVTVKRIICRTSLDNITDLHNLLKAEYSMKDF